MENATGYGSIVFRLIDGGMSAYIDVLVRSKSGQKTRVESKVKSSNHFNIKDPLSIFGLEITASNCTQKFPPFHPILMLPTKYMCFSI